MNFQDVKCFFGFHDFPEYKKSEHANSCIEYEYAICSNCEYIYTSDDSGGQFCYETKHSTMETVKVMSVIFGGFILFLILSALRNGW